MYISLLQNKKSDPLSYIPQLILFIFLLGYAQISALESCHQELSSASQIALSKFQKINSELINYEHEPCKCLLHCSYLQEIWLNYLHDAETIEDYHRGMELFQDKLSNFKAACCYLTKVFNLYHAENLPPYSEKVRVELADKEVCGYLNTFKIRHPLSVEERSFWFSKEYSKFLEDGIAQPFVLNASTFKNLEANTVYNFVLLPSGSILASVERPGKREYQVRGEIFYELFSYPNHTILAGHPEQAIVSAGSLIFYQANNKRLMFVSCKSGHFQPSYESLDYFCTQLAQLGINPCTIIPLPELDMSRCVVKSYSNIKIPISLTEHDIEVLFQIACNRWQAFYDAIDRQILEAISKEGVDILNIHNMETLKKQREEATYMRSAYHLFSSTHQPPQYFNKLVKRFGKLKSTFKHYGTPKFLLKRIPEKASRVLHLIEKHEKEMIDFEFTPTDEASFYSVLNNNISEMKDLLSRKNLTLEEYHQLKKLSRETGVLFMYMSLAVEFKEKGFLAYRTLADVFFQINELMSKTDYTYVEQAENSFNDIRVILSHKIANQLLRYLSHIITE